MKVLPPTLARACPWVALGLLACASGCRAVGPDGPVATPQRPTVSSDTNTTAAGTFELEAGASFFDNGFHSVPLNLKYGLNGTTELFVQGAPYLRTESMGEARRGVGDAYLGLRKRLYEDEGGLSLALQPQLKLPIADEERGLGSGEPDLLLAGIVTQALESWSLTGFCQLDVLGDPDGGAQLGTTLAAAVSRALPEDFGLFAELAALLLPETDSESLFTTLGATYTPDPQTVFDLGVVVGLSPDAEDFGVVVGLTRNLGPLAPR